MGYAALCDLGDRRGRPYIPALEPLRSGTQRLRREFLFVLVAGRVPWPLLSSSLLHPGAAGGCAVRGNWSQRGTGKLVGETIRQAGGLASGTVLRHHVWNFRTRSVQNVLSSRSYFP